MLHLLSTELETFITHFRAVAAENLKYQTRDAPQVLLAIDSWIAKIRQTKINPTVVAPEIAAYGTLDAKDLVLLTKLLPTMSEPLKLTLLHIVDMPERLHDPSLHDHLLTWIMKRSVPEARKLFFEVLQQIDNQAGATVEATKACQKTTAGRTYTADSKFFYLKLEERQYCCQVQLDGTSCSKVATYHDDGLGALMCATHVAELIRDPKKQFSIPVDALRVKFEEVAVKPARCEMAVGDNMLRLTQCDKLCFRGKKGKGDDFEICAAHATEIRTKNPCVDDKWEITTLTPVKCFQADLQIKLLRECEKDTWRCQVVVADYPICSDVATHSTVYGNLMCSRHVAYVVAGTFRSMSISPNANKIAWKVPKIQSGGEEELVEAVGPNLVVSKSRLYCTAIDSKTGQPCPKKLVFCSTASGASVGYCSTHLPGSI